jgi:hypothetical protein
LVLMTLNYRGLRMGLRIASLTFCIGLGFLSHPMTAAAQDAYGRATYDISGLGVTNKVDWYVTSDGAPNGGTHTTTPGLAVGGLNHDGVGRMFIDNNPAAGLGSLCSCSLLADGQSVLTAAHCVTNNAGVKNVIDGADGNTVTFHLAGGPVTLNFLNAGVAVAPGYNGDTSEGRDIAVIRLTNPAPATVPRYSLWSGAAGTEIGLQGRKVGYGKSGHGNVGHDNNTPGNPGDDPFGAGTKRLGFNEYDADARNILSPLGGGVNPFDGGPLPALGQSLGYDFDNGLAAQNAFTYNPINFGSDIGFGVDEVGSAPGDSGGATFLFDAVQNRFEIAGVTSYGFGFTGLPDITAGTNSSFGEVAVDMRVSNFLDFIGSRLVPEPSTAILVLLALAGFAGQAGRANRR